MVRTTTNGPTVAVTFKGDPNLVMKECAVTCAAILNQFREQALKGGADATIVEDNITQMLVLISNEVKKPNHTLLS